MLSLFIRFIIPALIILIVSELARRSPRLGALLLTLPLISILAFGGAWLKDHDLKSVSCLARETLILVPLGLPFFLPLAFAERFGLGFWTAIPIGFLLKIGRFVMSQIRCENLGWSDLSTKISFGDHEPAKKIMPVLPSN